MKIRELKNDPDFLACHRAKGRTFSRNPRGVNNMANAALERARALKEKKEGNTQTETKVTKKQEPKERKVRQTKSDIPWQKIADAYNNGLNTKEIAEKFGLVRPKTKDDKPNPYPYYLVVGYLNKLAHGIDANGKHIEITRGKGGTRKEK